jgi:Domain of unknown function (DUF4166)
MTRNTPLSQVFANYTDDQLPRAFREQFLATPERDYDVVLEGVMHRIWHRPTWLKPLFVFFGWLGILVPRTGEHIPAKLAVVPGTLPSGKPYHEWNRSFAFDPPIEFNTRVVYDDNQNNLADQVGPNRFLHLVWEGQFVPPRSFTLRTVTNAVQIGGRCVYLPHWLWALLLGRVKFIQTAHEDDDTIIDVDLRILHPLFGEVFGYQGTFQAKRQFKSTGA